MIILSSETSQNLRLLVGVFWLSGVTGAELMTDDRRTYILERVDRMEIDGIVADVIIMNERPPSDSAACFSPRQSPCVCIQFLLLLCGLRPRPVACA